jgi:hypothetical protein
MLGVSEGAYRAWENGGAYPSDLSLTRLRKVLGKVRIGGKVVAEELAAQDPSVLPVVVEEAQRQMTQVSSVLSIEVGRSLARPFGSPDLRACLGLEVLDCPFNVATSCRSTVCHPPC